MQAGELIALHGGEYRLAAPIAASSYGVVWRAVRRADGLAVALKLVNRAQMARAHPALHARWIDSVVQESVFLRGLAPWDERHIVRLLDSGEHQGMPAIALELLGPDLGRHAAALHAQGATIPLEGTLDWLAGINQALAKVHQYGWSYLDLKPANLLLHPRDGGLRLTDFGASRPLAAPPARAYAGTAAWQAPEQFFPTAAGYLAGQRSDYFSLGALFYYLVGGQPLQFCRTLGEAWRAHGPQAAAMLRRPPPTLLEAEAQRVERDAGPAVLELLRALLAPEPSARPANALAISRALARVRADAGVAA
jgi:serine/threonine-protein kinase